MNLPRLKTGQRVSHALPASGADALLIAELATQTKAAGRITAVVCADAADAQRLLLELPFFAPDLRCALFPDWETLPYDNFSPHQDLISERLATLWRLYAHTATGAGPAPGEKTSQATATASTTAGNANQDSSGVDVVLISATTALYRIAPPAFLAAYTFHFKAKQKLDEAKLKAQLTLAGYSHVSQVVSPGEYSVRGGLIDLFPMGSALPYRVDLFDDEIDSIRSFDPDSQRSLYPVPEVRLLPGREFPLDDTGRTAFRQRWRELFEGDPSKSRIYKDLGQGIATAGIEYYLPLFFEQTATVFDYLGLPAAGKPNATEGTGKSAATPHSATLVLHGKLDASFQRFWQDTQDRYRLLKAQPDQPVLPPEALFLSAEQFYVQAKACAQLALRQRDEQEEEKEINQFSATLPHLAADRSNEEPLNALKSHLANSSNRMLLLAESEGRKSSLLDYFHASQINPVTFASLADFLASSERLGIAVAALNQGFSWLSTGVDLVTESELFAANGGVARRRKKQEQASDVQALIQDLSELKVGDPVVHSSHGIGRYRGLVNLDLGLGKNADGSPLLNEFLHLEYADQAILYVPVSQLHVIGRYTGVAADEAPLHRLGSGQWEKAKRKAAEQVRDTAAELLNIYARRAAREGHAFRYAPADYEQFSKDFGFEETPDQAAAIHNVIQDMISPRPMDRLVCGDVGFGKTEVALRAAFIAVMGGKQVALLAPTTLLAEQHFQTLTDRFARWPVKVAEMSRFRSTKEITAALKGLDEGTVDIVVGTHKLLSQSTQFKNLGLLIIDEEHRFGVRHKEAMKALRAEIDVLTLTATPIPRTMGMALEGLRDLSVIATAPQRRLAIKTFVRSESKGLIREAVLRELKRGGQVYFLHNDVATIENRRQALVELLPEARIAVAHGQLPERELERVMRDFVAQRFNVLLCSTIIETGIDVASANTIVISRADRFGLAQLHQLRGRVGRSHHQAYAYLMVQDLESLTKQAQQRLEAITQMEELGSGFYLAMHDLEIRGAGEVLGENQSGNMLEVGFQLYNEMLSEAVRCLKAGKEPDLLSPLSATTEINLHTPALLPNDYCGDVHLRLSLYKKLATAKTQENIDHLQEEMVDRFGKLPDATQALIDVHRLRVLATPFGVKKIDASPAVISISFVPNPPLDPMAIMSMIQKNRHIKLAGNDKLRIERELPDVRLRVQMIRDVLKSLGQPLLVER
jgi:transcription-repair coupling factor (superfamily II helicase)